MLHIYYGVGETAGKPALWGKPPQTRAIDGAYKIFIVPL